MRFLLVALVGLMIPASAACTDKSGVRAKLDTPVPAQYVCSVGPRGDLRCHVNVQTQAGQLPIEVAAKTCDRAELVEDPAGKAVAYRCADQPWRVIRLRGGDRYLEECHPPLDPAGKPDWPKLGPFEPRALAMLECAGEEPRAWAEITKAIVEESGPTTGAKFVISTTLHPAAPNGRAFHQGRAGMPPEDGWTVAFDALPAEGQDLVKKETCSALQKPASSSLLYSRAARRCAVDATNVPEIALEAYKNRLAVPRAEFGGSTERQGAGYAPSDLNVAELGFVMEGFIALKGRPKEAAQISCDNIASLSPSFDPVRIVVAASILALTKTRCPALEKKSELWPCDLPSPQKSKISEHVGQFTAPPTGAPPVLASPSEALYDAISADGVLPPNWCK